MSVVATSTHLRNLNEPTVTIANGTLHAVSTDGFAVDLDLEGTCCKGARMPDRRESRIYTVVTSRAVCSESLPLGAF